MFFFFLMGAFWRVWASTLTLVPTRDVFVALDMGNLVEHGGPRWKTFCVSCSHSLAASICSLLRLHIFFGWDLSFLASAAASLCFCDAHLVPSSLICVSRPSPQAPLEIDPETGGFSTFLCLWRIVVDRSPPVQHEHLNNSAIFLVVAVVLHR